MKLTEAEYKDLQDWEVLCRVLPEGWEEEAKSRGALRRCRAIQDAGTLLRVLMMHLFEGCSLRETAVRARQSGLAQVSAVAILKRLRASEEWLRWLAEGMRSQLQGKMEELDRPVRVVDATTVSEPGSTGTDWRVHYAVNLATLQCDFFQITDAQGGEKMQRYPICRGDIVVGDRGYSGREGIRWVVGKGGDVVIRWSLSRPLVRQDGTVVELLSLVKGLRVGQVRQCAAGVPDAKGGFIAGRLIIVKRTRLATEYARKRIRQKLRKRAISPPVYRAAQYFFLWTSLQPETLSAEKLLQIYRLRWQIELAFKRLKSIMGVGHLPKKDPCSARAWLHGKLFGALLVQHLIRQAGSFSPWGYSVGEATQSVERDALHAP